MHKLAKDFKIYFGVFGLILSKVLVDIPLLSIYLYLDKHTQLGLALGQTFGVGMLVILLFNFIHRRYPFIYSIFFVGFVLLSQYFIFFSFPGILQKPLYNEAIPAFIVMGNLLLLLLLAAFKQRLLESKLYHADSLINYGKYSAIIIGSASILVFGLHFQLTAMFYYYLASILILLIALFSLGSTIGNSEEYNAILDNQQAVRIQNRSHKLLQNKYFNILILTAILIGSLLYQIFQSYNTKLQLSYAEPVDYSRIWCYYALGLGVLGLAYDKLLKKKIAIHLGIRAALRVFAILALLFTTVLLIGYKAESMLQNQDWNYLFLISVIFLIVLVHFSFEGILWPAFSSLFQPVNDEIRHDFYFKSYALGLVAGFWVSTQLQHILAQQQVVPHNLIPFISISITAILYIMVVQVPLYKHYKLQLQNYLNQYSQKIIAELGIFKRMDTSFFQHLKNAQFVRYLNILDLTNPIIARQAIKFGIKTNDNYKQNISLIKAEQHLILELLQDLYKLKADKYFFSSPNRDKISELIDRLEEIKTRLKEINYVEHLSISKKKAERELGALLAVYCSDEVKTAILERLLYDPEERVLLQTIIAGQKCQIESIIERLISCLNTASLGNAAYASLLSCGENIVPQLEASFFKTGQTEKVQLRIIQLYGEIASKEAVENLVQKLNHGNQNIISASLKALKDCMIQLSEDKKVLLFHEVNELCQILVWNLSIHLDINAQCDNQALQKAIQDEIDNNYANLFNLLSLLYDGRSIQLIQNNLFSRDTEKVSFALELAAVLFKDEMKHLLLPLLQPTPYAEKIKVLRDKVPTESLDTDAVCHLLIQREAKWISPWTKACALAELSQHSNEENYQLLQANMLNRDEMLTEIASQGLLRLNPDLYYENKKLLGKAFDRIASDILQVMEAPTDTRKQEPVLKFDIINYLQSIPEFSFIPGSVLKQITNHITSLREPKNTVLEDSSCEQAMPNFFYVLYSGNIALLANQNCVKNYGPGELISSIDLAPEQARWDKGGLRLVCSSHVVAYRIQAAAFIELFTLYQEIPSAIIEHTQENKLKHLQDFNKNQRAYNYNYQETFADQII